MSEHHVDKESDTSDACCEGTSRRKFLGICLGSLGTVLAGGIAYPVLNYLVPPSKKGEKVEVKIPASQVPLGQAKMFHFGEKPAVVIHTEEGFSAFSLVCSHLGCLVKWDPAKVQFQCPCHGAKFDSKGAVISGPPPTGLEAFQVRVIDGEITVS